MSHTALLSENQSAGQDAPDVESVVAPMLTVGIAGFVLKRAVATDLVPAVKPVLGGSTYVRPARRAQLPECGNQPPAVAKDGPEA
jgi:hypothetical protein